MRGEGKPQRALGFALLVLAAAVAVPALSVAQDPAPAEAPPPAVQPPAQPEPPEPPAPPEADGRDPDAKTQAPAEPAPPPPAEQVSTPAAAPAVAVPASAQAKAASASVSTGDNFFSPTSVSIFAGESVTWTNNGQTQHSATANNGSFDTGIFGPGASRSETFSSPGTYAYYCVVHGLSQSGTVRVASAAGGGGNGGGGGGAASDATSGNSEAAAVAAPDAAGTGSSLPATGFAVLGLGGTGLALLVSGLLAERRAGRRSPGRWFSIY